jgi:hypothetical protein
VSNLSENVRFLCKILCIKFVCNELVLVLVQIDLIQFESLIGCETRMDWPLVANEESQFSNLWENGQSTSGSCAFNTNDGNIKWDQWGRTCVMAIGCFSSFVTEVGTKVSGLGQWAWIRVSGLGGG